MFNYVRQGNRDANFFHQFWHFGPLCGAPIFFGKRSYLNPEFQKMPPAYRNSHEKSQENIYVRDIHIL